jgi:protein-S-isoprenylcysteine O-methyltransferase Ste14
MTPDTHRKSLRFRNAQIAMLCTFAVVFFLDHTARLFSSSGAAIAGAALCLLGLLLMLAAFVSLRAVIQIAPEPKAGGHLVTSGPYRWLRHPIYTGMLLLFIGLILRKPTLLIAIAAATVVVLLFVKAEFEERMLQERYPEYLQYKRRSWGIVPGLR